MRLSGQLEGPDALNAILLVKEANPTRSLAATCADAHRLTDSIFCDLYAWGDEALAFEFDRRLLAANLKRCSIDSGRWHVQVRDVNFAPVYAIPRCHIGAIPAVLRDAGVFTVADSTGGNHKQGWEHGAHETKASTDAVLGSAAIPAIGAAA